MKYFQILICIAEPFFRRLRRAFFRNFVPEKPSGHPFSAHFVRRKSMHGKRKKPNQDVFSGCASGTPLGRDLGAIAQTVRGRIVPSPEPPFFRFASLTRKSVHGKKGK